MYTIMEAFLAAQNLTINFYQVGILKSRSFFHSTWIFFPFYIQFINQFIKLYKYIYHYVNSYVSTSSGTIPLQYPVLVYGF